VLLRPPTSRVPPPSCPLALLPSCSCPCPRYTYVPTRRLVVLDLTRIRLLVPSLTLPRPPLPPHSSP
jgi:hypothetical protein